MSAIRGRTRYPGKIDNKSIGWTPLMISDCALWLGPESFDLLPAGTTRLSTWVDLSKNGNGGTNYEYASQPAIVQNSINGKSTANTDGSNDYLITQLASVLTGNNFTLSVVFKLNSVASTVVPIRDNNVSINGTGIIGYTTNETYFYRIANTPGGLATNLADELGTQTRIITWRKNATEGKIWRDGVQRLNVTVPTSLSLNTNLVLGRNGNSSSLYANAKYGDTLLYNKALSDTEINDLHGYLKVKWGIS